MSGFSENFEPCTGMSKQSGQRCKRRPRAGLTVCGVHGGKSPRADMVVRETKALRGMNALRDPTRPVTDPLTELLDVAARSVRLMEVMEDQVSALKAMRYGGQSGEQTRAELAAYERSLDRCAKILASIVTLDLEARLVRVSEVQAAHVIASFHATLTGAGIERGSAAWIRGLSAGGRSLRKVTVGNDAS